MGEMGRGQATRALAKESPGGSPGVGRRRGREPRPRPGEARAPGRPPYQREQEAPEQGGRGPGQRPLRPHRTAGRPATRRFSAGTGSGSRRCAASVAGPDRRGRRGLAGAAAAIAAAAAAPTSPSGSAQRTRKPPRGARGVRVRARRQSGWFSALSSAGVGRPPTVGLGVSLSLSSCLTRTLPRVRGGGGGRPPKATSSIPLLPRSHRAPALYSSTDPASGLKIYVLVCPPAGPVHLHVYPPGPKQPRPLYPGHRCFSPPNWSV